MRFDGLIFDLDGTLWDCTQACADAFNRAYEKVGSSEKVTKEFVASIAGKPSSECDEIILSKVPGNLRTQMIHHLNCYENEAVRDAAPSALYEGVEEGIKSLSRSFKLFVVSNCGEGYLETFLRHSPIGNFFLDSECFGRTQKLKHFNIRSIVDRENLSNPCYIGDTKGDEEAAEKACIPFFHVEYGYGKPIGDPISFANFASLTRFFIAQE